MVGYAKQQERALYSSVSWTTWEQAWAPNECGLISLIEKSKTALAGRLLGKINMDIFYMFEYIRVYGHNYTYGYIHMYLHNACGCIPCIGIIPRVNIFT